VISHWLNLGADAFTVFVIFFLWNGTRHHRRSWYGGYWTGRSELQDSLGVALAEHHDELQEHPERLALVLTDWCHQMLKEDTALVEAQQKKRKKWRRG
jgi:hypothetical protein